MQYLEIQTRICRADNTAKTYTTKFPITPDFDRALVPALVEAHWKQKLLSLQINSRKTYEHIESSACIVSFDLIYSTEN